MTFRSDDDAREERVRSLEKQLEESRKELHELRPKAGRLDIAEKENRRLMAELSRSAGGSAPRSAGPSRAPLLLLVGLVALLVLGLGVAGFVLAIDQPRMADDGYGAPDLRAREEELARRAQLLQERELEVASREAAMTAAQLQAPIAPAIPVPPQPPPVALPIDPATLVDPTVDFPAIMRAARVVAVSGEAPVARRAACHVSISPGTGDCRAEILCGPESLYPRTGRGGYFHCQVTDHVLESGADANATPISGDPRLELDIAHRRVTISDASPDWSVTVAYDDVP